MPPIKQTVSDDKNTEIPSWVYEKGLIFDYVAYLSDILGGYVSGSFNNSEAVISDDSLKVHQGQATTSIESVIFWFIMVRKRISPS